jgi:hypothetical protein
VLIVPSASFKRLEVRLATAFAATLVGASIAVAPASSAPKTTEPGVAAYRVNVVLTDKSITIEGKRFNGKTMYPRGTMIGFIIRNEGKHSHRAQLKLVSQHYFTPNEKTQTVIPVGKTQIQPGDKRNFGINFYFRGSFALQLMAGNKVLASAPITIF